jgi:ribose transport system substrate-binding protein
LTGRDLYKDLYAQQDGQFHPRRSTIQPNFLVGPRISGTAGAACNGKISPEGEETMKLMKGMALSLAALAVVLIPGCGARHSPKEVFYLVASNMSTNYWQTAVAGFKKAAAEYGVTARAVGPDKYDPQAELAELQSAVAAKPSGILISVSDAAVLTPGINAAVDAGIPVITIDSDAASHRLYFIGTNNLDAGRLGGRRVVEKLGGKGNVVFFTITGQPNTEERLKGFKDVFATRPGINIVDVVDIKGDTAVAFDRTQQLLAQTGAKKIDAFICLESASGEVVAEAIKRSHDTSRMVVAWDVNPDTLQGIKDGVIDATIVQKPFTMGYVGLKALDEVFHNPPAQLSKDSSADAFAPYLAFIDTGTSLVDKTNVDVFLAAAAAHAK